MGLGNEEGADLERLPRAQVVDSVKDVCYFFVAEFEAIELRLFNLPVT